MTERRGGDDPVDPDVPWEPSPAESEPEPDWAAEIRERRKARGDRLRQIFDTFDDEKENDT